VYADVRRSAIYLFQSNNRLTRMTLQQLMQAKSPATQSKGKPASYPVLNAQEVFRGYREVCLIHQGLRYRLRITRRNKLILQK
jgi:hemin uptake protein HemP